MTASVIVVCDCEAQVDRQDSNVFCGNRPVHGPTPGTEATESFLKLHHSHSHASFMSSSTVWDTHSVILSEGGNFRMEHDRRSFDSDSGGDLEQVNTCGVDFDSDKRASSCQAPAGFLIALITSLGSKYMNACLATTDTPCHCHPCTKSLLRTPR